MAQFRGRRDHFFSSLAKKFGKPTAVAIFLQVHGAKVSPTKYEVRAVEIYRR